MNKSPIPVVDFITYMRVIKNRTAQTTAKYEHDLCMFLRHVAATRDGLKPGTEEYLTYDISGINFDFIKTISSNDILEFLYHKKSDDHNESHAIARRLSSIKSFFKYLTVSKHILDENPAVNIETCLLYTSYDKTPVLRNISFSIPQGSTTAIVGPSGSGKTTICNLIARFYDVDSGKVLVGGENVRDMTCDSLLRNISMVFQKVYLFHDTIENNIRFGNPNASQEEVIAAAKKARCHDFIMSLPEGYQTVIGEGGSTLSGGEKQRVSIARAILKNADIVILDEATASIDPENEHLIQQAISELTIGKTVIVIAHRLATIEHADQILVVDDGRIVQKGTHNQLIRQEGIYKRFINIREQAEGWSIA